MLFVVSKCNVLPEHLQLRLITHGLGALSQSLCHPVAYAMSVHPAGKPLLQECVAGFLTLFDRCRTIGKMEVLAASLWRLLAGTGSPISRQFAICCWCEFLDRVDAASQTEFVACSAALMAAAKNDNEVLTEAQRLFCDLWGQALPLLEPPVQQSIVQSLSLNRMSADPAEPWTLSLPVKAQLLAVLPLPCLSQVQHQYLCVRVLRVAIQELEQWVAPNARMAAGRAQLLDVVVGLLQHRGLIGAPPDVLRCCDLLGSLFDPQHQRLVTSSPAFLRSALQLASSPDLMRCYTPQRTLRLLSSLEPLLSAHPWTCPLIAQFLGNTAHIPLQFHEPALQEEIFRKLCRLFHAVLSVKEQPEQWGQFAEALSMFHTFSSHIGELFEKRLAEFIPRVAYDDVIGYMNDLANPPVSTASQEWAALLADQKGAAGLHSSKKRALETQFEEARNVKLKSANVMLRDLCSSMRALQTLLGGWTGPWPEFQEADQIWQELQKEAKRLAA